MALRVLFVGASTVNFGGAPGPWDHSRRLEKLGGVKASPKTDLPVGVGVRTEHTLSWMCLIQVIGIADPDVTRAGEILERKLQGPHAHMYTDCEIFSSYQDALGSTRSGVDVAFIGEKRLFGHKALYKNRAY